MKKETRVTFRMGKKELTRLKAYSERLNVNLSELIRWLLSSGSSELEGILKAK